MLNPPNLGEIYENMNTNPRNSLTMLIKNGMNKQQKKFTYNIVKKLIFFFYSLQMLEKSAKISKQIQEFYFRRLTNNSQADYNVFGIIISYYL